MTRAAHLLVDAEPPIFRDDYALSLSGFTADEATAVVEGFEPDVGAVFRATVLVRARFTEEQLEEAVAGGVSQYVILGAGLDSFAWRRPDLVSRVETFEVDHPGTQAYKRDRLAAEGMSAPAGLHFVAMDFTADTDLGTVLADAGYRSDRPTVWSWLGVLTYLTPDQIRNALRRLAELSAAGSVLVGDFVLSRSLMDDVARAADDIGRPAAAGQGESYLSTFEPEHIVELTAESGWRDARTWLPFDFASWFEGRSDSMSPSTYVGLFVARRC